MKTWNSRLWTPDYCRILLANLLLLTAGNAMGSTFSLYLFSRGGTELDVGISSYIQASACFLIRPLAGWFLDHRSRKTLAVFGLFRWPASSSAIFSPPRCFSSSSSALSTPL